MTNFIFDGFKNSYEISDSFDIKSDEINEVQEPKLKNVIIKIEFANKVSVKHTIPIYALSLTSKLANMTVGFMSTDEFICRFENELNNIASAYSNLYHNMGLEVIDIEYMINVDKD